MLRFLSLRLPRSILWCVLGITVSLNAFASSTALNNSRSLLAEHSLSKHPLKLVWAGHAYGEKAIYEETISKNQLKTELTIPEIPFFDTFDVQDGIVTEQDQNGQVRIQSGNARARMLSLQKILSGEWLQDEKHISEMSRGKEGEARVRWSPTESAMVEVTFGSDFLPKYVAIDAGGGQFHVYGFTDWREENGALLPHGLVIREPNIQDGQHWILKKSSAYAPKPFEAMQPVADSHFPDGLNSITLPLSLFQNRYILVPVKIGSTPAVFVLDSGASSTVLNLNLVKKIGLKTKGSLAQSSGAFGGIYFVKTPALELAGAKIDPQTVIAIDLESGDFGAVMPGIDGILGYDFISRFVVTIDYEASKLTLTPLSKFKPERGDVSIPVTMDESGIMVDVTVRGVKSKFLLDTGNGGGIAVQHVPGQEAWVNAKEKKDFYDEQGINYGSGTSGSWDAYGDFEVGPFNWQHAPLKIADEKSAQGGSLSMPGNVGSTFLKHFRVSLDMSTPRLWLAQTIPFRDRPGKSTFGFGLRINQAHVAVIKSVHRGGPAAKAGIKVGDVITLVNDVPALAVVAHQMNLFTDPVENERVRLTKVTNGVSKVIMVKSVLIP